MFFSRGSLGSVEFAFTDRDGGVSAGPWRSLNLGTAKSTPSGDSAANIEQNMLLLANALGVSRIATMSQTHGSTVNWADSVAGRPADPIPECDALLCEETDVALLVRVADCTPIVLADPQARIVGVVHAGRVGLVGGVVTEAVATMRSRGATRIQAWIGPRACGDCYEVPPQMADEVAAVVPETRTTTRQGTPGLDIGRGVIAQLEAADVKVFDVGEGVCTIEHEEFFSYRRQGADSGRQGGLVVLRSRDGAR